jgi:hypothetical protein
MHWFLVISCFAAVNAIPSSSRPFPDPSGFEARPASSARPAPPDAGPAQPQEEGSAPNTPPPQPRDPNVAPEHPVVDRHNQEGLDRTTTTSSNLETGQEDTVFHAEAA